ncbi:MAG: hypothetical protein HY985_13215, partial [Magnetospirillum sp.]|nr:hypothetical protein [Magnetospirillum sp.]
ALDLHGILGRFARVTASGLDDDLTAIWLRRLPAEVWEAEPGRAPLFHFHIERN